MVVHSAVSVLLDSKGIQMNPIQTESEGWERHWGEPNKLGDANEGGRGTTVHISDMS